MFTGMLDHAFIIALLLSALNLGKLALRPHQVAIVQDRIETWTLALDTLIPSYLDLIKRVCHLRGIHVFSLSIVTIVVGALILSNLQSAWALTGWGVMYLGTLIAAASGLWRYAPDIIDKAQLDEISFKGTVRLFSALICSILIIVVLPFIGPIMIIVLCVSPKTFFRIQALPAVVSTVTVIYFALLLSYPLAHFLLGVLWRITEYGSGAWAALLFLVTGALGIAKVMTG